MSPHYYSLSRTHTNKEESIPHNMGGFDFEFLTEDLRFQYFVEISESTLRERFWRERERELSKTNCEGSC